MSRRHRETQPGRISPLSVSSRHIVIQGARPSDSDVASGCVFEVVSLEGLHSGANGVTGDFSLKASGFLCRDGQREQAVRGVTIAGNFYRLLQNVVATGETSEWDSQGSFMSPRLRFRGCTVAGS